MKFRTELHWNSTSAKVNHRENILFLGSCFAENMGLKFKDFKFNPTVNPNGIVFHPLVLEHIISKAINNIDYTKSHILTQNEQCFSWFHHSSVLGKDITSFIAKLNQNQAKFAAQLLKCNHLFLTFGTAWGYELNSTKRLVANCHKFSNSEFSKKLSPSEEITTHYVGLINRLKELNPNISIHLSVSPVRHIKDGIIENNRSKAQLISAAHNIVDHFAFVDYIPAYEWIIDDLRDYRFYDSDLVHPSSQAIEYVWGHLSASIFNAQTQVNLKHIAAINSAVNHQPFQPEARQHQQFIQKTISKIEQLEEPLRMRYSLELTALKTQLV